MQGLKGVAKWDIHQQLKGISRTLGAMLGAMGAGIDVGGATTTEMSFETGGARSTKACRCSRCSTFKQFRRLEMLVGQSKGLLWLENDRKASKTNENGRIFEVFSRLHAMSRR